MEKVLYGEISQGSIQIVDRNSKLYIRYDAGAHQISWREDEITHQDFTQIVKSETNIESVLLKVQNRLISTGVKPYISNWNP